jgi:hypothetical protein
VIFSYQTHATSENRNTAENQNAGRQARPLLRPVGWPKERTKITFAARKMSKRENKNYFRGPENVCRVQEWRKHNPVYWRRKGTGADALQDHSNEKIVGKQYVVKQLTKGALQDLIANTTRSMQQLGADILNSSTPNFQGGDYASKNPYSPRAGPPGP